MRSLGETSVRKNLSKLPHLAILLSRFAESPSTYRLRKIDYALSVLAAQGTPLQMWRIQRLAGLRKWSPSLVDYTTHQIENFERENSLPPISLS